jgi:cardiolipin synthase A/B
MPRSPIVLPCDSAKPILDAIHSTRHSLRIKMSAFSDPSLLQAVTDAKRRGVSVRVMLNPTLRNGETENEESRNALVEAGVEVLDGSPAFDLTHEKSMWWAT